MTLYSGAVISITSSWCSARFFRSLSQNCASTSARSVNGETQSTISTFSPDLRSYAARDVSPLVERALTSSETAAQAGNAIRRSGASITQGGQPQADRWVLILERHQRLTVRVLRGNHDPHSHLVLTFALAERNQMEPRVTVDNHPRDLFMFQWGRCAIFAHHGDKGNRSKWRFILAM